MLQSMGSQRVRQDLETEQQQIKHRMVKTCLNSGVHRCAENNMGCGERNTPRSWFCYMGALGESPCPLSLRLFLNELRK